MNLLALGVTGFLFTEIYPSGIPLGVSRVPDVELGFLSSIPVVGDFLEGVFGSLNLLVWLMLLTVVLTYVVLFKTPIGLRIRAVGEHPRAADTVGISVYGVRYAAVVTSGVLAALGGAFLSLGFVGELRREHDERPRVHRPRRGHLREVASRLGVRRDTPLRVRVRTRDPDSSARPDISENLDLRPCRTC